jgi:spore germination protein KC
VKKRIINILLLMGTLIILSSCGYKDIDRRSFVVTIGVDKSKDSEKKYKVMLKIAIPTSEVKVGEAKFIVSEYESNSITEAVRMINTKVDKELDFSHAKAIVLGEEMVKEDTKELLDWFIRRRDIQKIAWVGIGRPTAKEVISIKREIERLPSNALFLSFGRDGTESGYIISEYLFDFRKRVTERGLDPILPIIEARGNKYFEINEAGVFNSKKLKMSLSKEDTRILNILLNRAPKAHLSVKMEEDTEHDSFFIAADVLKTKFDIKNASSDNPSLDVRMKIEGIVEESLIDINNNVLKRLEKQAEKQFRDRVTTLLTMFQEENLDPVGFGIKYRARSFHKDDWEKWQKIYPTIEIKVTVDITLQGTGLLN